MIAEVKKYIDASDIKGLRYIFLDSLDIDPTFEKYEEDYATCNKIEGFFETYTELTPLSINTSEWNMDYWGKLKYDQKMNFSEKRFEHMKEVAKVVYAEKVDRLLAERAIKQTKNREAIKSETTKETTQPIEINQTQPKTFQSSSSIKNFEPKENIKIRKEEGFSEDEMQRISESRREIELHNKNVEKEKLENEKKIAERKKEIERRNELVDSQNSPKKVKGIVIIAMGIILLIVVVVLIIKAL